MTYRAAVIGLGRMGSTFDDEIEQGGTLFLPYCHAPSYTAHERVDLVAGADPHPEQRQIFADRWGLEDDHVYADYVEMLEAEKPDIVSICTTARGRHRILLDTAAAAVGVSGCTTEPLRGIQCYRVNAAGQSTAARWQSQVVGPGEAGDAV